MHNAVLEKIRMLKTKTLISLQKFEVVFIHNYGLVEPDNVYKFSDKKMDVLKIIYLVTFRAVSNFKFVATIFWTVKFNTWREKQKKLVKKLYKLANIARWSDRHYWCLNFVFVIKSRQIQHMFHAVIFVWNVFRLWEMTEGLSKIQARKRWKRVERIKRYAHSELSEISSWKGRWKN